MELPELVQEHLGDEDVQAGLALGDDDLLCLTPTRTLLYRADGLLSDERVTEYPHDVERLELSEGRRKTKVRFEYVEDERTLTVPAGATHDALALVLEGILSAGRVLDPDESVVEAFRFSELTLVVADHRIVKHVGNAVWDTEYEAFAYEDLTGVEFERARVATEVVLSVDGRPERIKTPNDDARLVERAIERALTEYFDVTSMSQLQSHFQSEAEADETDSAAAQSDEEYPFNSEIRPLGEDPESRADPVEAGDVKADDGTAASDTDSIAGTVDDADADEAAGTDTTTAIPDAESASSEADSSETDSTATAGSDSDEAQADTAGTDTTEADLERIDEQLVELTTAVNKQNELLRKHHAAIKQLVEELQSDS